jgi:membrane-associated protease RseP (regulator of RpoE activity)
MVILTIHELAHYVASRRHHVSATLPYFIPAPSFIGTFGAFIKMTSPIVTRRALIDIGASGPIAGFIVSVIASIAGLCLSEIVPLAKVQDAIVLGDSLLFSFLSRIIVGHLPDTVDILLHPVAFAGWIGLFVTSLNLLPVGQLDGGHIAFAILGGRHRYVSITFLAALATLGFIAIAGIYGWEGWGIWAVLLLLLRIQHPPVLYWETPLDRTRKYIALASLLIFIVTFIPAPFKI